MNSVQNSEIEWMYHDDTLRNFFFKHYKINGKFEKDVYLSVMAFTTQFHKCITTRQLRIILFNEHKITDVDRKRLEKFGRKDKLSRSNVRDKKRIEKRILEHSNLVKIRDKLNIKVYPSSLSYRKDRSSLTDKLKLMQGKKLIKRKKINKKDYGYFLHSNVSHSTQLFTVSRLKQTPLGSFQRLDRDIMEDDNYYHAAYLRDFPENIDIKDKRKVLCLANKLKTDIEEIFNQPKYDCQLRYYQEEDIIIPIYIKSTPKTKQNKKHHNKMIELFKITDAKIKEMIENGELDE